MGNGIYSLGGGPSRIGGRLTELQMQQLIENALLKLALLGLPYTNEVRRILQELADKTKTLSQQKGQCV